MSAIVQPSPQPSQAPDKRRPTALVPQDKKPFPWIAGVLLAFVAVAAGAAYMLWLKPQAAAKGAATSMVKTAKIAVGSISRTVRVAGQTSARNYALVTVPIFRGPDSRSNLTIMKLAAAGTMVSKGELIAQFDQQTAQDHIDDVRDQVAQAAADVRKRKAEQQVDWGNLQQTLLIAKSNLDKARLEYKVAEVKTDIERQLLKLNLDEAEARYKQLQGDIENSKKSDQAELRILEISGARTQLDYDRHMVDISKFQVKAPIPGLVVMQQVYRSGEAGQIQQGDLVSPGQQLMKIVDPYSMQVEGSVNQSQASEFRLGETATVGLDAFPELRLKGKVYTIGSLAVGGGRENFFIRSVPVRVTIEGRDARVIPDLSAWADVELARKDNVLIIPREAMYREGGQTVAFVRTGGRFEKRQIRIGMQNATRAEVISGLNAGDEVALEAPKTTPAVAAQ